MRITWYVEDGYMGSKSRPHHITVPDDELADCNTAEAQNVLIDQYVQDAFEAKIYYHWDTDQLDKCPKPREETEA